MVSTAVTTKEYGFLSYNATKFGENRTFRHHISPPSSGSKSKAKKETPKLWALSELHSLTIQKTSVFELYFGIQT
jgi:hypothetical protein